MRELDDAFRDTSARPVLRPTPATGPITKRMETSSVPPSMATLGGRDLSVRELDARLEEKGVFQSRDRETDQRGTPKEALIPRRALTEPHRIGRTGRKAVYPARFKTTEHMAISVDLKQTLMRARLPSEACLDDTIRRLAGLPPREFL